MNCKECGQEMVLDDDAEVCTACQFATGVSADSPRVGRPSKYKPEMCEQAIELMKEGASLVEVAAEIGVRRSTIYDWMDEESDRYIEEFSDTIKRGVELSQSWWEKQGRTNLVNKYQNDSFNASLWYMNMKNRFGWKDKHDHAVSGGLNITKVENVIIDPANTSS